MSKYIETVISGNPVFVEVSSNEEVPEGLNRGKPNRHIPFETIINDVKQTAKSVFDSLQAIDVEEVELTYGVKLGVKAGLAIWMISEISSEANFTIKVKWRNPSTKR